VMELIPYRACYINAENRSMLFFSSAFNGIFRMDLNTGKVQNMGAVPGEKIFQGSLYGSAVPWGRWLVLIPLSARELAILDRETGQCVKKIKLPGNEENGWKFADAVVYGDDMVLVPACYPYFLSLNMIDFSVTVLQDWKGYLEKECALSAQRQLTVFTVGRLGALIYLQVMDSDCLLGFDMEKKRIAGFWRLPDISGIFALCDERNIYIVPGKSGQVLRMNAGNGRIEKSWPMPVTINESVKGYASVHGKIIQNKLILFPQMASRIGVIDLQTGETGSFAGSWSTEINGKSKNIFQKIEMLDERHAVALVCHETFEDYECFLIDTCDFSHTCLKMHISWDWRDYVETVAGRCMSRNEILYEKEMRIFGCEDILGAFLTKIGSQETDRRQSENRGIGEQIYLSLRKGARLC